MKIPKSNFEQKVVEKFIFLRLGKMHDCANPCMVLSSLITQWMYEWGQTKAYVKITSIPTTLMNKPKLNLEQKVVKMVVFLSLDRMHDRADRRHDHSPSETHKTWFRAVRCARVMLPSGMTVCLCQVTKIADFLRFCLNGTFLTSFSTQNSSNSTLIFTSWLPYHSKTNPSLTFHIIIHSF
jgi:hypothetical protein